MEVTDGAAANPTLVSFPDWFDYTSTFVAEQSKQCHQRVGSQAGKEKVLDFSMVETACLTGQVAEKGLAFLRPSVTAS